MVTCNCGRVFSSTHGWNAHKYYCNDYVDSLSEHDKVDILERKRIKQEHKDNKRKQKQAEFLKTAKRCPVCNNLVTNMLNNTTYCSKKCASVARYANFSDEHKHNLQQRSAAVRLQNLAKRNQEKQASFASENHKCEQCGIILTQIFASGRFCSKRCSDLYCANYNRIHREEARARTAALWKNAEMRNKYIESQHRAMAEGRWPSMMQSSSPSYPEKYWMAILDDENIRYTYDYVVKHSDLGIKADKLTWYKLDFYLHDYNLDLEIDGSQHNEQVEHDKLRDDRLEQGGYLVYRIPWKGHWYVDEQLAELKCYLESISPDSSTGKNKKADEWGIIRITESDFRTQYM